MASALLVRGVALSASFAGARTVRCAARGVPHPDAARSQTAPTTSSSSWVSARRNAGPGASSLAPRAASTSDASGDASDVAALVRAKIAENKVTVWSKTYCPFCTRVKGLFEEMGVEAFVVELDRLHEEAEIQDALAEMTGQRTVPNVFIGGAHVGGCDDTHEARASGELERMLKEAGAV